MNAATCSHLATVTVRELPASVDGCADCLRDGTKWLHLRICLQCGHVGCCDDSPQRHATAHFHASGHPIIRSLEPGEDWSWCYVDEVGLLLREVTGTTRIPPSPLLWEGLAELRSSQGCDGRSEARTQGASIAAIGATEDAASGRPASACGTTLGFARPS